MKTVDIQFGGKLRKLRFGSANAQDVVDEIHRAGGFQLIPGQRLQIADAANLALAGDPGVIQVFLRRGLLNPNDNRPDKNLTADRVYQWIDEHLDPTGNAGEYSALSGPIVKALVLAGLVKAEAVKQGAALEDGDGAGERPTNLTVVAKETKTDTPPGGE